MDFKTIFDGWGTELISKLISLCFGNNCVNNNKNGRVTQKQKAGKNAKQRQEVTSSNKKNVSQRQDAGDDSEQTQIG